MQTCQKRIGVVRPMKSAAIEIRTAGSDVLVHDTARGKVHVVNITAGRVLERCDGSCSAADIAGWLSDTTGADRLVVERDVAAILREFAGLGLVADAGREGDPV